MARKARQLPVRFLRIVLLVLSVVAAGGVALLYWFGRSGGPESPVRRNPDREVGEEATVVGEGFDSTISVGDLKIFRIKADSYTIDRDETYSFQGVEIEWFREDGSLELTGAEGKFNPETEDAEVYGDAVVRGDDGMTLYADGLVLENKGRAVVSVSAVDFEVDEQFRGRADDLRFRVRKNILILSGNVTVEGVEPEVGGQPLRLTSSRLAYERRNGMIRAEGGVQLENGRDRFAARRLSVKLGEDDKAQFIQGRWGVSGSLSGVDRDGVPETFGFTAFEFSALIEPGSGDADWIELDGGAPETATMSWAAGGLEREMTANFIRVDFDGGAAKEAEALGSATIVESVGTGGESLFLRRACAQTVTAQFGERSTVSRLDLSGSVEYHDGEMQLAGTEATIRPGGASLLEGQPATLKSANGHLEAPRIKHFGDLGRVEAGDSVRAVLEPRGSSNLAGGVLGETGDPVQVLADRATWSDSEASFSFEGSVRAWQERNLLLADRLRGNTADDVLVASGAVRTTWHREPQGSAAEAETTEPLEVAADEMEYRSAEGLLAYRGRPQMHQSGRLVTCDTLDLELDDQDEVHTGTCNGRTRIRDPIGKRVVEGETARYDVAAREIRIVGDPVSLKERDGAEIRGPELLYDLATGIAQMIGKPLPPPDSDREDDAEGTETDGDSAVSEGASDGPPSGEEGGAPSESETDDGGPER